MSAYPRIRIFLVYGRCRKLLYYSLSDQSFVGSRDDVLLFGSPTRMLIIQLSTGLTHQRFSARCPNYFQITVSSSLRFFISLPGPPGQRDEAASLLFLHPKLVISCFDLQTSSIVTEIGDLGYEGSLELKFQQPQSCIMVLLPARGNSLGKQR